MKRLFILLSIFISIGVLSSCQSTKIALPDIEGMTYSEASNTLRNNGISFYKVEMETTNEELENTIYGYKEYEVGDKVDETVAIYVYVYIGDGTTSYFEPLDLIYDGPYLSDEYSDIDYMDPRGGYFEVTLKSCTDGDTSRFYYPDDVYNAITSTAKSVRFLLMDTEETFSGGEEEWGKPASLYTCSLLESAYGIIIQTDPGDSLTDTYGRLLGWIWVQLEENGEYQLLNYMVVRQGLAQVKYEYGSGLNLYSDGKSYSEWMHLAEDTAILEDLGQWGSDLDYYWDYENDKPKEELWR